MKEYDKVRTTTAGFGAWNEPAIKPEFDVTLDEGESGMLLKQQPAASDGSIFWFAVFRAPAGTDAAVYTLIAEDALELVR